MKITANTPEQADSLSAVKKAFRKAKKEIRGFVFIGKAPQGLVIDVTYQAGQVYISKTGKIEISFKEYSPEDVAGMAAAIAAIS